MKIQYSLDNLYTFFYGLRALGVSLLRKPVDIDHGGQISHHIGSTQGKIVTDIYAFRTKRVVPGQHHFCFSIIIITFIIFYSDIYT